MPDGEAKSKLSKDEVTAAFAFVCGLPILSKKENIEGWDPASGEITQDGEKPSGISKNHTVIFCPDGLLPR